MVMNHRLSQVHLVFTQFVSFFRNNKIAQLNEPPNKTEYFFVVEYIIIIFILNFF